jgi:predicted unusual protein kinase regulating ubiquinone biosynthesis (AarF/ABC1/UbiB family)
MKILFHLLKLICIVLKEYLYYMVRIKTYDDTIISILIELSNYNIIFTKIFQWSCNNVLLTEKINVYLNKYTNKVPYNNNDIDYKSLLTLILYANKSKNKLEITNIEKPINSGSISLIFNGKLNDKQVVIKILRNNINNTIKDGLDLLIRIGFTLKYIPKLNMLMFDKLIEKNKLNLLNQINFVNEVKNLEYYYENFKTHKYIVTPYVYSEYTDINSNLIIMDNINGKYLYELLPEELDSYYYIFAKFIIKSIFSKKILHGDLHPGNILFFNEIINENIINKIGIIDMGMVFKLSIIEVNFIYLLFLAIFDEKFMNLIKFIKKDNNKFIIFETKNELHIINCIDELKNKYLNKKIFNDFKNLEQVIEDIYLLLEIINNNNCAFETNINKLVLAIIPMFNVIRKLGPKIDKNIYMKEEICKLNINI